MRTWQSPNDATRWDLDKIAALRQEITDAAGLQFQISALIDGHWITVYSGWNQDDTTHVYRDLMFQWSGDPLP